MLDFDFGPAQDAYRVELRAFALRELAPGYVERDALRRYPGPEIRELIRFQEAFWKGREDARDLVSVGITAEEVARGDLNCVLPALGPVYQRQFFGDLSQAQAERWLPGLLAGDHMVALAITEPAAGSDMGRLQMTAVRRGDTYVLNGVKNSVSFLQGELIYVFARTHPEATGWNGISAFLLPRETPGLSFAQTEDLGCRSIPRGVIRFDDVVVTADAMVGAPGTAFVRISRFFDVNRAVIGLKCIGAALQTLDETVEHAKRRVVFGQPLAGHQGVAFPLAEHATWLELARWQCYRVLWLRDRGRKCQREGAMVKWAAPKLAAQAIHQCLLFHGHYGYEAARPIQQRLRDVIGWQIGDGSEEVMKLILQRELFAGGGDGGV